MNQKGFAPIAIILIIAGILIVGTGIWYWQKQITTTKTPPEEPTISSITILSPNGGENWIIGKTYQIQWTPTDFTKTIGEIRLYKFPYLSLDLVWTSGNIPSIGNYSFTVFEWLGPGEYQFNIE